MNTHSTIPMQRLLQHRQWVRNLARTLVLDAARADDLEQQTWLAALERPPAGETPKAWLGTVMRNLAGRMRRSEYRVDRREGVAARPERLPATADVVAQAEIHKQVVQAVLDLEEPYRETVLLRHYQGLPPREVAERMGVPVETVRSRVRRGLEQVRRSLDAQHGGDGHAWKLVLLPLAKLADGVGLGTGGAAAAATTASAGSAGALTGALLMPAQSKVTAAVLALVLLAGGAWFLLDDRTDDVISDPLLETTESPETDEGPSLLTRGSPEPAGGSATANPAAPSEGMVLAKAPGAAWVRVVRGTGAAARGVKGAGVVVAGSKGTTHDLVADARGRAELPTEALGFETTLWILDEQGGTVARRRTTLTAGEFFVRLPAPGKVSLVFETGLGGTVEPENVVKRFKAAGMRPRAYLVSADALRSNDPGVRFETMFGLSRGASYEVPLTHSLDDGTMSLALRPASGRWQLLMDRPYLAPDISAPFRIPSDGSAVTVAMRMPPDGMAHLVRIEDPDGNPLEGATITPYFEIGDDAAFFPGAPRTTGADGEVKLPLLDTEGRQGQRMPTWWAEHEGRVAVISPALLDRGTDVKAVPVTVHPPAAVRGRAWLPTGEAAVGRTILWTRKGYRRRTEVRADGTFELTGIPVGARGRAALWIFDDLATGKLRQVEVDLVAGQTAEHDIGADVVAADVATLQGHITEGRTPLAGILVLAQREGERGKGRTATTDADGRYEIVGLAEGSYRLRVVLGDFRVSDDYGIVSKERFPIASGQIETRDFDIPAGHVEVVILDAVDGQPVLGAMAIGHATAREVGVDTFEGFRTRFGWGQAADEHGVVRLRGLPTDTELEIRCGTREEGYTRVTRTDVRAGSADAPTRIEVRLERKP